MIALTPSLNRLAVAKRIIYIFVTDSTVSNESLYSED